MDRQANNPVMRETQWPDRLWRYCLLATLHDLKCSVQRRQPISLPNLLRMFRRRCADAAALGAMPISRGLWLLQRLYLREQPFRAVNWVDARHELMGD